MVRWYYHKVALLLCVLGMILIRNVVTQVRPLGILRGPLGILSTRHPAPSFTYHPVNGTPLVAPAGQEIGRPACSLLRVARK